jgi:hypothetical protein
MKEVIQAIGAVITSPYPYFAVFGYFGLQSYSTLISKEITTPSIVIFGFLLLFLAFLCVLVFVLIQKVGHLSMLSPEYQVELEKIRSLTQSGMRRDELRDELRKLKEKEASHG